MRPHAAVTLTARRSTRGSASLDSPAVSRYFLHHRRRRRREHTAAVSRISCTVLHNVLYTTHHPTTI